ncbi:MAG: DNA polymerase III subunit delta [Cyanophyceae cyanobacterium]
MPIYLFWGEDDFAIASAVGQLRQEILAPSWQQFNYHQFPAADTNAAIEALNQAMTPAFGLGGRLVWLVDTSICQQCSETLLAELERTLPAIPDSSCLLLTTSKKPDRRLKSTKLLQKYATVEEFSLIPPWKTEALEARVQQVAKTVGVTLTADAVKLLAEAVGNNTRQLWNELEKLRLYGSELDAAIVATLVHANTQNSLQLAAALRTGNREEALRLATELIDRNEPALRIVATLVGQFRTWLMIKLAIESGESNEKAIAQAAEVSNPKRVYFLRKEVSTLSSQQLVAALPVLLELELSLKQGAEPLSTLQTKTIELCRIFGRSR